MGLSSEVGFLLNLIRHMVSVSLKATHYLCISSYMFHSGELSFVTVVFCIQNSIFMFYFR